MTNAALKATASSSSKNHCVRFMMILDDIMADFFGSMQAGPVFCTSLNIMLHRAANRKKLAVTPYPAWPLRWQSKHLHQIWLFSAKPFHSNLFAGIVTDNRHRSTQPMTVGKNVRLAAFRSVKTETRTTVHVQTTAPKTLWPSVAVLNSKYM